MMNSPGFITQLLKPIQWGLDSIQVDRPEVAILICRLIPNRCPFQRCFSVRDYVIEIPPLCQLNPFYPQLIALRLRALTYLIEIGRIEN
jgi:Mo-dependent nitrogenase C-terminus